MQLIIFFGRTLGRLARGAPRRLSRLWFSNCDLDMKTRWLNPREEFDESSSFLICFWILFLVLTSNHFWASSSRQRPSLGLRLGRLRARLLGSLWWPPSDPLLDPYPLSKVTPFLLTASHRTVTFRSDRARAPFWVSGGHLLFSECCRDCGVARISLGIRLCVRRRCVSTFHCFLTFLKRACGPGAVKNSKISKIMKFLDVRKTNGITTFLRCPDVVLVISIFFLRFVNASCEKI